jgi:hypothetical protein
MLMRKDDDVPYVELYVKRRLIETDGRTIKDVLTELNQVLADIGVRSERWLWSEKSTLTVANSTIYPNEPVGFVQWPLGRIICYPMRGRNEAFWVDLLCNPRSGDDPVQCISSVKCWSWQEAVELTALTAQLLDITD